MIINNNLYYNKYIRLENAIPSFLVIFTVKFVHQGTVVTKTSDVISYQERKRVIFASAATSITVDVFKYTSEPSTHLFHIVVLKSQPTCFRLSGSSASPRCTEVPCK